MKWPVDGILTVEGITPKVESVTFLAPQASDEKITLTQDGANLNLRLPGAAIDPNNTVLKVTLAEAF